MPECEKGTDVLSASRRIRENKKTVLEIGDPLPNERDERMSSDFDPEDQFQFQKSSSTNRYKCDICSKLFAKKYNLTAHKKALHSPFPKKHVCDICGKEFSFKSNYNTHKYVHMDLPRNFKCSQCNSAFKNARGLKNHLRTHETDKNYVCEVCGKAFAAAISLKNHMSTHSEVRPHFCDLCKSAFKRQSHLQQHQREVHGVNITKMARNFVCDQCKKSFTTSERLEVHKRKHTGDLPFECRKCWRSFASQMGLNVHHTMGECQSKCSSCKTCQKDFKPGEEPCIHVKAKRNKIQIEKPIRVKKERILRKDKPRNFECEVCKKTFIFNCDKKQHYRTCHTNERPYICDECGKAFKAKNTLHNHQAMHSDSRPFPCTFCEKRFRRAEQLMLHTRTHTGEKPHICNVCGRGFAQIGDMKKHRRIHSRTICNKNDCTAEHITDGLESEEYLGNSLMPGSTAKDIEIIVNGESLSEENVEKCFVYRLDNVKPIIYMRKTEESREKNLVLVCVLKEFDGSPELENLECNTCKKVFKTEELLRRHLIRAHEGIMGRFNCHVCDKSMARKDFYEAHVRKHLGDLSYECKNCLRRFSSRTGLKIHRSSRVNCGDARNDSRGKSQGKEPAPEQVNTEKVEARKAKYVSRKLRTKTKPCPVCGKLFLFESEVKAHVVVSHTKEKKFVCEECGKSFKTNQCFKIHERIHSDRRPYPCRFCDKRFRTLNHIKQHIRTHTGEKPYVCPACGKRFAQSGDKNKHLFKVHPEHTPTLH